MPGSDSREASAKEPKSHIEVAETLAVPPDHLGDHG